MLTTHSPADRAAIVLRLQRGFLGALLSDMHATESGDACEEERDERDVEASPALKTAANRLLAAFINHCGAFISADAFNGPYPVLSYVDHWDLTYAFAETIGSDLYMELAGHASGFADRNYTWDAKDVFCAFCEPRNSLDRDNLLYTKTCWVQDCYIGEDSLVYPLI